MKTINQTIDHLLNVFAKNKNAINDKRVSNLMDKLLELKMSLGGNTKMPDEDLEKYIDTFVENY